MKIASRSRNTYKEFNPRSTKVESEWVVRGPLSWLGDLGEGSGEGSRGPPGCPGCNDFSPATGETLGWDCHGPSTVAHGSGTVLDLHRCSEGTHALQCSVGTTAVPASFRARAAITSPPCAMPAWVLRMFQLVPGSLTLLRSPSTVLQGALSYGSTFARWNGGASMTWPVCFMKCTKSSLEKYDAGIEFSVKFVQFKISSHVAQVLGHSLY